MLNPEESVDPGTVPGEISDDYQALFSEKIRNDPEEFIQEILGICLHPNQRVWIRNAKKKINILRPGNRWGKTFVEACLHIWHCMCKPLLKQTDTAQEWLETPYITLNFGPEYEGARECLRIAKEIVEGRVSHPEILWADWGKFNDSKLKGWAIVEDRVESTVLPNLKFITGADLLARSYNDMGSAFKAKNIAFMSGDECADIAELWTFTNLTLLPRLVGMGGIIHFVGTVQPEGYDYMEMISMAEEDMKKGGDLYYVQKGTMYNNEFLNREEIKKTEAIADPILRVQIIEGEYVMSGNKYFGFERVYNAVDKSLEFLEDGVPNRKYITGADYSGGKTKWGDFTVIQTWDYTEEPYKMVYFFRVRGSEMSIPMQYEATRDILRRFPGKLIIDGSALGGKNAAAYLRDCKPIGINILVQMKADILSTLKVSFDGYQSEERKRILVKNEDGDYVDTVKDWGLLRFPDNFDITKELINYKLDDKKLRNDIVISMALCIWWIEMRRPKLERKGMVKIDWASIA